MILAREKMMTIKTGMKQTRKKQKPNVHKQEKTNPKKENKTNIIQ